MSARNEIMNWMLDNCDTYKSVEEMVDAATKKFTYVICMDTFIWDDAQTVFELREIDRNGKKYAR